MAKVEYSKNGNPILTDENPLNVDKEQLTFMGSLNYIVQAWRLKDDQGNVTGYSYDQYQPRRNRVWTGHDDMTEKELIEQLKETKERMKIAMDMIDKFVAGEIDAFYYWEFENEGEETCPNYHGKNEEPSEKIEE